MRTYICDSGSGVAAVTIAVDRETADASRGLKWLRETVTYTCVPYVYNWSQDVEKCTLDLVLSSSTRTNTVQATAVASKPRRKSLQDPLLRVNEPPALVALFAVCLRECSYGIYNQKSLT